MSFGVLVVLTVKIFYFSSETVLKKFKELKLEICFSKKEKFPIRLFKLAIFLYNSFTTQIKLSKPKLQTMETIHKVQDTLNEVGHKVQEAVHESQQRPDVEAEKTEHRIQETVQKGKHMVSDAWHANDTVGQKIDRVIDHATKQL